MNPNTEGPLRDPRQARRISSNRDDDGDGEVMVVFENLSSGDALMGYRNEEVRRNLTSTSSNYSLSATESRTNAPNFRGSSGYSARRNESNGREIGVDKEFQPGRSSGGSWLSQEGYHADRGNGDFSKRSRRSDLQRFRSKFDKFLSEKRGLVFRPLAPDELPVLESTSDELENEGCYGVAPTLDLCLDMDVTEREREFYRTAACGDVVLTKMSSRVKAGLSLQLLCFEGKKRAFLEDLNIVVTCPNWETIPRDHYDLGKDYEVGDEIRCEIVKLNTSSKEILVGMRATYASIDLAKKFPLGLVSEEELPQHYKIDRKVWQSKKKVNFNDIMNTSSGFNNPNSIGFLGSLLGIYSNHNSLTLGLSHPFPKSTLASSLRLIHNTKLAEENLNQGLNFLRSGNTAKALDSFNKTVIVDPGNIRALVSRAIIHTQEKNVVEAMRDLDVVLKRKLESTGIKKDVAQCLVSLGKLYQENSEEEKALKVYNDSMLVVPDHPDTLKLLMIIHSQIGYFTIQGLMMPKIGEFKERLNGMIEEEICKERSGYYRKFVHSPQIFTEHHRPLGSVNEDTKNVLVGCRERAAEERSVSPLAHIREVAYREAKNRQDSDTDTLLVRKKKKWKRKKSRRQSESSNASESRSDQVCSRRSSMTDCEDIEDQVNAFLAKCERDCGKVTAAIPLESVRITIAQAVPKEPEVRFIAASSAGGLDNHRIDIASTDPLYQDVNKGRSIVSLPDKFNLLTDKYGNLSTSQNIIQTVTRTQVSTSKFEMTVSSSKPTSSFVPIPTVFSSPSASSDDGAINPVASTLSKWKPVMGQALDENRTPEPELSFKTSRACNEDLERRIELVNLKVNSIEGLQNYGYREDSRSRSRSSSIPGSTFQLRSRASVKSWSRSKSKSRSRTKSRSRSNSSLISHSSIKSTRSNSQCTPRGLSGENFRFQSNPDFRSRSTIKLTPRESLRSNSKSFRSRYRENSRSRSRRKSISPQRYKSRSFSRQRSYSRRRSRSMSRERSRSVSRGMSRSISRGRSRSISRGRSRSISRGRSISISRARSRCISRERSKSRSYYRQFPYHSSGRGRGRIARNKSNLRSPLSEPQTRTPVSPDIDPPRVRFPRRGGYDPNYISPNYKGYNPIPAYKLDQLRTVQAPSNNSINLDDLSVCRTPGRVSRSVSSPRSPGSN